MNSKSCVIVFVLQITETEPEGKTTGSTTESSLKTTTAESPSLETKTTTGKCHYKLYIQKQR